MSRKRRWKSSSLTARRMVCYTIVRLETYSSILAARHFILALASLTRPHPSHHGTFCVLGLVRLSMKVAGAFLSTTALFRRGAVSKSIIHHQRLIHLSLPEGQSESGGFRCGSCLREFLLNLGRFVLHSFCSLLFTEF